MENLKKKNPLGYRSFRDVKVTGVTSFSRSRQLDKEVSLWQEVEGIEVRGFQNQSVMPLLLKACSVNRLDS